MPRNTLSVSSEQQSRQNERTEAKDDKRTNGGVAGGGVGHGGRNQSLNAHRLMQHCVRVVQLKAVGHRQGLLT